MHFIGQVQGRREATYLMLLKPQAFHLCFLVFFFFITTGKAHQVCQEGKQKERETAPEEMASLT